MRRKPLSGAVIGILVGLAIAVILARQGVWPPDQLTVFLVPAITGLVGMAVLSVGREDSTATMLIAVLILVPMLVWGAFGFGLIDQSGELYGGCTVSASTDLDSTTVTDTSRRDPFRIDPDGALTWEATSPEVFTDYEWEIHTLVGGIAVPIESDTEPNEDSETSNGGQVPAVGELAAARGINLDLYTGVYQVGGSAATCDGFGFVRVMGDGIDLFTILAIVLIVLLIVLLLILFHAGRETVGEPLHAADDESAVAKALEPYEAGSGDQPDGEEDT